ncbi:MAG: OmpH family outer membrane protein [Deltaproteobacteria bacterium]|nr:OmpH family outer membrane protein [Deltaproteobacteria bacterium]
MKEKTILVIACCIVLGLGFCTASYAETKVGYINLQRLVNESDMGKAAKEDIRKLRQERESDLKVKLEEFNKIRELINKKGGKMDPAEKRNKLQERRKVYKEYQRLVADAKEDIVNEDRELVAIILQKADNVLKRVAKDNEYTIIVKDPNAIGYLDPEVDITDLVLEELNE